MVAPAVISSRYETVGNGNNLYRRRSSVISSFSSTGKLASWNTVTLVPTISSKLMVSATAEGLVYIIHLHYIVFFLIQSFLGTEGPDCVSCLLHSLHIGGYRIALAEAEESADILKASTCDAHSPPEQRSTANTQTRLTRGSARSPAGFMSFCTLVCTRHNQSCTHVNLFAALQECSSEWLVPARRPRPPAEWLGCESVCLSPRNKFFFHKQSLS